MNEQAIQDAYNLFVQTGYKGDINAFSNLIKTNPNALNDSYNLFVENGYNKTYDDYKTLVGVNQAQGADLLKKKGQGPMAQMVPKNTTESFVEESLSASQPKAQVASKQKAGILAQPFIKPTTESFLETVSAEPSTQPSGVKEVPPVKEKNYFTGDFGTALAVADVVTPFKLGEFIDDIGRSIASGYRSGALVTPANEVMLQGKKASPEQIQKYLQAAKEMEGLGPSDEMQNFSKIYDESGKGVFGFLKGLAYNPTVLPEIIINSTAMLANPTAIGSAAATLAAGGATGIAGGLPGIAAGVARAVPYAMGAASTTLETGLTFSELLKEELDKKGLEFNEKNVKDLLQDDKIVSSLRGRSVARGATIGIVDALTNRLAGSVGKNVVAAGTAASRIKSGIASAGIEAVGGSAGEAAGRLVAGQPMDVAEIGLEGITSVPSAIPAVAAEVLNKPIYKINGQRVTEADVKDIVDNTPVAELGNIDFDFKNDRSGWAQVVQQKVVTHSTKEQVREANPDLNETSLDAITKLELDLQKLQGNTTQSGKDKAAALRQQIKDIQENQLQEEAAQQNVLGNAYRSQRISDAEKALAQPENKNGTVIIDDKEVKRVELEKELETLKAEQNAIQEQRTNAEMLRSEQPELGLREVGEGNTKPTEPTTASTEVITDEKSKEIGTQVGDLVETFNLFNQGTQQGGTPNEKSVRTRRANKAYKKLGEFFGFPYGSLETEEQSAKQNALRALGEMLNQESTKGYTAEGGQNYQLADVNQLMTAYKEDKANGVASPVVQSIDTLLGITPAAAPEVATTTSATEDQRKNALRELMQATGDDVFISGTEDGTFAGEGLLNVDSDGNVVLTRHAESEGDLVKSGQVTSPEDLRNLTGVFGGEQVATSGVEGGLQSFKSGVVGEYKIPLAELVKLIKDGYVTFAGLGNKEFVLSPHIAQQYLSTIKDSSGKVIKENQVSSKTQEQQVSEAAPTAEQAPVEEVVVEEEQFIPLNPKEVTFDTKFSKDEASDYQEDEREGENGRYYPYFSEIETPVFDVDGEQIGYLVKMVDDDKNLTFEARDEDGNPISKNEEGFDTLGEARQALVDNYNKIKKKEFDKEAKKKAKERAKQAEKAAAKAAKAAAKEGAAKVEEVQAIVDDLLALDPNDKSTAQKISDTIGKAIKDIEKFEKTSLGVNVALPIIKGILQAVKALIDAGISLQQAIKKVAQDNNITEQQVKDNINIVPILDGFNQVMTKVDALIARQKAKGIADAKIVSNIDTFIRNSDVYKAANDAQKKILEKEGRAKMGVNERRAPSIGRVLGALKDFTNISREEKIQIIKQIRNLSQDAAKSLSKEIKEMAKTGKITVTQAANVIARFGKVNLLNEISVGNFVDYMARVFNDAEYAQKIDTVKKQLSIAKKNIATKIGMADGLMIPLRDMLAINPNLIPDSVFDEYVALVDMFGQRKAVLTLAEKSELTKQVQAILDAVNKEQFQIDDLAFRMRESKYLTYNEDGTIDFAETLKEMLKNEEITQEEADLMRKYKSDIVPQVEPEPKSDKEIQAEKQALIDVLNKTEVDSSGLPSTDERNRAKELAKLIRSDAVKGLSVAELKNLLKVINNINNNFFPHYANLMARRLESINNSKVLDSAITTAKPLTLTEAYAKVKSMFTNKSSILEMIRRNPLANIDQVFGNFKTKEIFNSLLNKPAEASSAYQTALKKVQNILEDAEAKVAKSFGLDPNKTQMSKFKMMTYLIQLEYDSNPDNKQVNPASDFLKATIKHIESGKSRFGERDSVMLDKILSEYTDGKGNIDADKLYKSFNDAEKSAIKSIQSVNESLAETAAYTASVIRGQKFNPLNNYVHLNVLHETEPTDLTIGTSFATEYNNSMRPSTKAKSLIERTGKVSPLNFDVFASAQRGAKFVLLDYNLTDPITTSRMTLNQAEANLQQQADEKAREEAKKNGVKDEAELSKITRKISKKDREVFNAIRDAFEESVENLLTNSVVSNSLVDDVVDYINKQGYRAILAGTGRFIGESSSNIGFALISDPKAFIEGVKNRGVVMSADAPLIMQNVKSKQTSRIFPTDTLSGRAIDTSILSQAGGIVGGKAKSIVANQIQKIWNQSGKKYTNSVELIADSLISTPDKVVMRPMWFGSFANEFKAITGKDVDFEKIAANDEAYMNANQDAIEQAKTVADERSVMTGATDNAFMGVLKGTVKPNQSFTTRAFNNFNNFMTKFLIFEYVTARTGIMAAMGNGSLSRKQGAAVLAAVTTRMIVYTLVGQMLGNGLMGMFFDDEEPEDDKSFLQKTGQALASTFTSLLLGRDFGNATKAIVNAGVETINEKYLDFLREGEYDPYKDSIQFSIIPKERKGKQNDLGDLLMNMGGAFGPALKTANFLYVKATEEDKKKADAIERQQKERTLRVPLEILGNAGFVPLYKDVRKMVMKEIYSSLANAEKNAADKKRAKEEMLQGFETETDMKRYDPALWNRTFGPSSEGYDQRQAEKALKREKERMERAIKDAEYNYVPTTKSRSSSSGFGPQKNSSSSGFGPQNKKGKSGFGPQ